MPKKLPPSQQKHEQTDQAWRPGRGNMLVCTPAAWRSWRALQGHRPATCMRQCICISDCCKSCVRLPRDKQTASWTALGHFFVDILGNPGMTGEAPLRFSLLC